VQRMCKFGNTQNANFTPDKALNMLTYGMLFLVMMYRSYKLLSAVLAHSVITDWWTQKCERSLSSDSDDICKCGTYWLYVAVIVKDIMTDMTAYASEQLHMSGVKAVSVHAGMLNAARNIQQRLTGKNKPLHMHAQQWSLPHPLN